METDPMVKAFFGKNIIHIGMNFIVQGDKTSGKAMGVFQSSNGSPMLFGGEHTHQLILGDVFLRPHLVVGSKHLCGNGISGIYTNGFVDVDGWLTNGKILLNAAGDLTRLTSGR